MFAGLYPSGGRRRPPLPRSTQVSAGIADLPTGVPCRRDEGVPPYRGGVTPAKNLSYTGKIPVGRTMASAPTTLYPSKCGHRRLAIGGSPTGGRGTPLPYKASPWGEAVAKRLMRGCFLHFVRLSPTPHPSLGSLTLTLVPPSPKGEGLNTVVFRAAASRPEGEGISGCPPLPHSINLYVISPSVATRQLPHQRAPRIMSLFSEVIRNATTTSLTNLSVVTR